MPLMIRVHETATKHCPAERAQVRLRVEAEGGDKAAVSDRVRTTLQVVTAELSDLERDGAVRRWSNNQVTTWSYSAQHGGSTRRGALTHQASADVRAAFADFEQLAHAIERWCEVEEVRIEEVRWELTAATTEAATHGLRSEAVRSAVQHAQQFAQAANKSSVDAVSIEDSGSSDSRFAAHPASFRKSSMEFGSMGEPHLRFAPEDVPVSISITAEFAAG